MTEEKKQAAEKAEQMNQEVSGGRFEDLTPEDMAKIQAQGGTQAPRGAIWDLINSTGQYQCRK